MTTVEHGYNAYTHGCRCEVCRAAKAAYVRVKRAEARQYSRRHVGGEYIARGITHGTISGYRDSMCRCPECKAVKRAVDRRHYAARKARAH